MDGNGRWAQRRHLPRVEGHAVGADSVREITKASRELGIPYLTLYAFSKENWERPKDEVRRLMELLELYLEKETPLMVEKEIRLNVIGDISDFSRPLQRKIADTEKLTAKNTAMTLSIALSYGGRQEILRAATKLAADINAGKVKRVTENIFSRYLYTKGIPDPDLLIRTSGEMRISNFLLWQIAYTELYVTDTLWPDFRRAEFMVALKEYGKRDRRFGTVKDA